MTYEFTPEELWSKYSDFVGPTDTDGLAQITSGWPGLAYYILAGVHTELARQNPTETTQSDILLIREYLGACALGSHEYSDVPRRATIQSIFLEQVLGIIDPGIEKVRSQNYAQTLVVLGESLGLYDAIKNTKPWPSMRPSALRRIAGLIHETSALLLLVAPLAQDRWSGQPSAVFQDMFGAEDLRSDAELVNVKSRERYPFQVATIKSSQHKKSTLPIVTPWHIGTVMAFDYTDLATARMLVAKPKGLSLEKKGFLREHRQRIINEVTTQ
ncbi:hypothetical protein JNM87_00185 [Candidatus Saccharibacteria bacterium]|nr:hypothetical protein [Candidatus Saccharibacteria bacterium]